MQIPSELTSKKLCKLAYADKRFRAPCPDPRDALIFNIRVNGEICHDGLYMCRHPTQDNYRVRKDDPIGKVSGNAGV